MRIDSIITHGPDAAVNGVITTERGGAFAFCDIYRFTSASGKKINALTSYVINLPGGE